MWVINGRLLNVGVHILTKGKVEVGFLCFFPPRFLLVIYINNKFIAVGITEEFDSSLKLFKDKLNWTTIPKYRIDNKTTQKKITNEEVHSFFEANKDKQRFIDTDLKVYAYAKEKFLKDIANCLK